MKTSRAGIMVALLALTLVFAAGVDTVWAKTYAFKYANTQSENHPRSQSMVFFKNTLEKATGEGLRWNSISRGFSEKKPRFWIWSNSGPSRGVAAGFLKEPTKNT